VLSALAVRHTCHPPAPAELAERLIGLANILMFNLAGLLPGTHPV
jgi:hypothetical protein